MFTSSSCCYFLISLASLMQRLTHFALECTSCLVDLSSSTKLYCISWMTLQFFSYSVLSLRCTNINTASCIFSVSWIFASVLLCMDLWDSYDCSPPFILWFLFSFSICCFWLTFMMVAFLCTLNLSSLLCIFFIYEDAGLIIHCYGDSLCAEGWATAIRNS